MKKIYLIIILIIALYSIYFCKDYDKFKNLNIKFEKSIFQIHSQNIKFNWIEPFKYQKSYESIGTCFLIDKKGYILTCSHVINNSIRVFVSLPAIGKKTFEAEVINFCPRIDIALIKIKENKEFIKNFNNKIKPLELGNSDKITPGEKLLALGYPLGEDKLKRTSGIISGIQDGRIQTDTPMNAGNSGGPLINRKGEVIGINFAIHKKGMNIGYAVPINQYHILERLKLGEAKTINQKNHFFSRIHVEDIANILFSSLNNFKTKEIYNISDNQPASAEEVTMYDVKLLGIDKPKTIEVNEIESEMLKNFYKDSKKVDNKKMKEFFNYKLKYPTYVEGLNYIFNNTI